MWDCFYGSVACCVLRVRHTDDSGDQLDMGETLLVEMIVIGNPYVLSCSLIGAYNVTKYLSNLLMNY